MNAGAARGCCPPNVALIGRLEVVQPGEDERPVPEGLERLQDRRELETGPFGGRRPREHVRAVAEVDGGETRRRLRPAPDIAGTIASRNGKRDRRAHSANEGPPGQRDFVITIDNLHTQLRSERF